MSLECVGLEKANFINNFHLKYITDKFLELDNSFESVYCNTVCCGKETRA